VANNGGSKMRINALVWVGSKEAAAKGTNRRAKSIEQTTRRRKG